MIAEEFTKKGFHHKLVAKIGRACVYFRQKTDGTAKHYEVIVPSVAKKDMRIGEKLVLRAGDVSYPSSSSWGTSGFTTPTFERAMRKLQEIA